MNINRAILPVVLSLALLALTGFAALRAQDKPPAPSPFDDTQFPVVEEYALKVRNAAESSKDQIKTKKFQMEMPAISLPQFGVAAGTYHWPSDFSPLPVAESTLVIVGEVTSAEASLSDDRRAVYSDFKINPLKVFKDTCNVAKEAITATRYGGKVKFQGGNTLLVFNTSLGMPRVGRRYLFFLRQTEADSDLLTAYELRDGKVIPLDSGTSLFDAYRNLSEGKLLEEVQQKIESLSKSQPQVGESR